MATVDMPKKVEEGEHRCRRACPRLVTHCAAAAAACLPPLCASFAFAPSVLLLSPIAPSPLPTAPALFYRLKQHGFKQCQSYGEAYAECCHGRVFSIVWACRKEMKALSDCMSSQ